MGKMADRYGIVAPLLCGGLLLGLGLFRNLKSRAEIRRLTKQLQRAQDEAANLRANALKDF